VQRNLRTPAIRALLAGALADELEALDPPMLDPDPDPVLDEDGVPLDDQPEDVPLTYEVLDHAPDLGDLHLPAVMVAVETITTATPPPLRDHRLQVIVVEPRSQPGRADDRLDALASGVLDVLQALEVTTVEEARRGTYAQGARPAYVITVTMRG
jgi:hypothetical protein